MGIKTVLKLLVCGLFFARALSFSEKTEGKKWNTCIKVFYSFNELLHSKTTGGVKSKRHKTLQLTIRTNLRQL